MGRLAVCAVLLCIVVARALNPPKHAAVVVQAKAALKASAVDIPQELLKPPSM